MKHASILPGPAGRPATRAHLPWVVAAGGVAAVVAVPVAAVIASLLDPRWEIWRHLWQTQLPELVGNTLLLLGGVGLGTGLVGTGLAWLVTACRFPGRAVFEWALILPLAVPAYVIGFVLLGLCEYTGPVQAGLRALVGPALRLPAVPPAVAVSLAMTLVLYPYVYVLARSAFAEQRTATLEAARSLGRSPAQAVLGVMLPLARPAIAAGVALAMMEALADYGTVAIFGYRTLTEGLFRVWFGMFDRTAGMQLAALLALGAVGLLMLERWARGRARFHQAAGRRQEALLPLSPVPAAAATAACGLVLGAGFLLPVAVLGGWALQAVQTGQVAPTYLALIRNSVGFGLAASGLATLAAALLGYGVRLRPAPFLRAASRVSAMGYAMPGGALAVGILTVFAWIDHAALGPAWQAAGLPVGMILTGSALGLLLAYVARFLALGIQSVDSGLARIPLALDEAARGLGARPGRVLRRLHLPLLRTALLAAALLIFIEVMKEMPATLLLRPFGVDTLAVEVWQRTSESQWIAAALPALAIVGVGLLPVILLIRLGRRRGRPRPRPAGPPLEDLPVTPTTRTSAGGRWEALPAQAHHPVAPPPPGAAGSDRATGAAIRLEGICKGYRPGLPPAVDALSLQVEAGEILALLGPSGCGKTTTLRLIAGFEAPDAGRITLHGQPVAEAGRMVPAEARGVGMVFQDFALFPHLTVAENVAFGLHRLARPDRAARLAAVLRIGDLADLAHRYPHELSGGQQQRAALVRALAPGYPVVLLDEPLSNLDADLREQLGEFLRRLLKQTGRTALFVTHSRAEAFQIADRIGVLRAGHLEQVGRPEEIYHRPATEFVARFMGEASLLPGIAMPEGVRTELGLLPCRPTAAGPVRVLLRPEYLELQPDPAGPALVTDCRFQGETIRYTLALPSGTQLLSQHSAAARLPVGSRVAVRCHRAAPVLFPDPDQGEAAAGPQEGRHPADRPEALTLTR